MSPFTHPGIIHGSSYRPLHRREISARQYEVLLGTGYYLNAK
jgi:hypothetical protein